MPEQNFDSLCIDCGKSYAKDQVKFHQNGRCKENNISSNNPLTPQKTFERKIEIFLPNPKPFTVVSKQSKPKIQCPYCSFQINANKYQRHIDLKCPARKQFRKNGNFRVRLRDKLPHTNLPLKPIKQEKRYVPVEKTKIRCSHCGQIYSKFESHCPECLRLGLRTQSLIKCSQCEKSFDKENFDKHLSGCLEKEVCCLLCKETLSLIKFEEHKHVPRNTLPVYYPNHQRRGWATNCEVCGCRVSNKKYTKHLFNLCPKVEISCLICKVKMFRSQFNSHLFREHQIGTEIPKIVKIKIGKRQPLSKIPYPTLIGKPQGTGAYIKRLALKKNSKVRRCRLCGRIAMYNSGHCYSCGDK